MAAARAIANAVVLALLRFAASGTILAGCLFGGMALTLLLVGIGLEEAAGALGGGVAFGTVLAVGGAIGARRVRAAQALADTPAGPRQPALAAALLLVPAIALALMGPLLTYARDVLELAVRHEVWRANGPGAALVLAPAGAFFFGPGTALLAVAIVVMTTAALLASWPRRASARRGLEAGLVIATTFVAATWVALVTLRSMHPAVEALVRAQDDPSGTERDMFLGLVTRHLDVVASSTWAVTASVSAGWCLAWLAQRRATEAGPPPPVDPPAGSPFDGESSEERREAFAEAAERLRRSTPSRWI